MFLYIFWTIIFFYIKYVPLKTIEFRPKIILVNKNKNSSTAAFCFNYFLVRACSGTILRKKKIVRYAHVNLCHFFLPPGDRGWPRLLLLALPGLFCLPFFVIIKLFLRKTCLDEVSIKINNLVSYTYAIVNISASARDYLSFRRLLPTTFENLTRNIYSLALISKNIRKKVKTEHICLFFVCLFFFIYFTLLFLFYFILFSFFLSFFLSFILSLLIYLFV